MPSFSIISSNFFTKRTFELFWKNFIVSTKIWKFSISSMFSFCSIVFRRFAIELVVGTKIKLFHFSSLKIVESLIKLWTKIGNIRMKTLHSSGHRIDPWLEKRSQIISNSRTCSRQFDEGLKSNFLNDFLFNEILWKINSALRRSSFSRNQWFPANQ